MTFDYLQIVLYVFLLLALAIPLGNYMAAVYSDSIFAPENKSSGLERLIYRLCGIDGASMDWRTYASAVLVFNAIGLFVVYAVQRLQSLPFLDPQILNPQALGPVSPDLAFNTAVSFVSNTNWQSYGGETTMSYLTQMFALTVQNFLSAATGMAVLVVLIRAFAGENLTGLGNYFRDMTRTVLYILLPLSTILAIFLIGQGVVQTFGPPVEIAAYQSGSKVIMPRGPVASQVAIKQLGTNGGGYFNVNSAHPLENPTPLSNFLEMLAILLIPAALCQTFARMTGKIGQGRAFLAAMLILFGAALFFCLWAESTPVSVAGQTFVNMEGKEWRFGVVESALWAVATTAASNGSVNAMHDSFSALGGLMPAFMMQLGEVVFGGVGSGLYGLIVFALITVFIAGLMVGRTPEFLSKKIEAYEIKMCSLVLLVPPLVVLLGTALACSLPAGQGAVLNTGPHAFTEILYAFSSAGNNNGSAFAGLSANNLFYNVALGIAMFASRYWLIVPVLAMAGSLASKSRTPVGPGTMPTDNLLFVVLLVGVVLVFGGLTFVPSLALGPIVEHLLMCQSGGIK